MNCQTICDSNLLSMFFAVVGTGSTNDSIAYDLSGISQATDNLPVDTYFVGDAAYALTENMIIPFTGSAKMDKDKDAFNFLLSQTRIRIEKSFGMLTTKWRILRKQLETSLKTTSKILEVCARLHNFAIKQKIKRGETIYQTPEEAMDDESNGIVPVSNALGKLGYLRTHNSFFRSKEKIGGTSLIRDAILNKRASDGYRRPVENIFRKIAGNGNQNEL